MISTSVSGVASPVMRMSCSLGPPLRPLWNTTEAPFTPLV